MVLGIYIVAIPLRFGRPPSQTVSPLDPTAVKKKTQLPYSLVLKFEEGESWMEDGESQGKGQEDPGTNLIHDLVAVALNQRLLHLLTKFLAGLTIEEGSILFLQVFCYCKLGKKQLFLITGFCLIVLNLLKEVSDVHRIQAPDMIHTLIAFVQSINSCELGLNPPALVPSSAG